MVEPERSPGEWQSSSAGTTLNDYGLSDGMECGLPGPVNRWALEEGGKKTLNINYLELLGVTLTVQVFARDKHTIW